MAKCPNCGCVLPVYKEVSNFIRNELKLSKEDLMDIIREKVEIDTTKEIQKFIQSRLSQTVKDLINDYSFKREIRTLLYNEIKLYLASTLVEQFEISITYKGEEDIKVGIEVTD